MQNTLTLTTDTDKRGNADTAFEKRAKVAQRKDMERTMKTARRANEIEIELSMFEDETPTNAAGQVSLF